MSYNLALEELAGPVRSKQVGKRCFSYSQMNVSSIPTPQHAR